MARIQALHLTGPVLTGPEESRGEAWVLDGRLTWTRPSEVDVTTVDGWVLPGLVDAHCHIGLGPHGAVDREETERQAVTNRDAGALLLRDAGSPVNTRWVDARLDLPVLIRAGRHIARTGRYLRGFGDEVEPEGLVATVRQQVAAGDGWVKLVGDWIDRGTGDLEPCWPVDIVTEAIAAAHSLGARVTAHCFGEQSVIELVEAGIDCIEHGTGLNEQSIPILAEHGVAVVPTLVNIATFPQIAESATAKFPRYASHMRDLHARRYDTIGAAHDAGIALYAGTDAGGSIAHGLVAHEVLELRKAGLSDLDALSAASWGARAWLGHEGLVEGAPADLLVCDTDPRADLQALRTPRAIVLRGALRPLR